MSQGEIIEGAIAVEAVLETGSRAVHTVYIRDDRLDTRVAAIQRHARERQIPLERLPRTAFDALVAGNQHGGVAARVGPRILSGLGDLIAAKTAPVIVMLDGVEDPYNFGQSVRALYAAGIDGLVLPPRNWLSAGAVVVRASAGATEWMPTAVADSAEEAAQFFRAAGFQIACAATQQAEPMTEIDLRGPLFLVIGGEKRGITRSFLAMADVRVMIPYGRQFPHALGTATAAAVLAFEIARQRRIGNSTV